MSLLESIRNKPKHYKLRLMYSIIFLTVVLLAALWVITSKIGKQKEKDFRLFKTIGRGFNDIKNNWEKK